MTPPAAARPTVLVVDDESSIVEVLRRFAAEGGFAVVTCGGGQEAIEHLKHHRADVALVDLRMPGVGGLEVLRAIRDADPECRVVLMSGHATIDSAVEAIRMGAFDYLTKPFDIRKLKRILTLVSEDTARQRALLDAEHAVAKNAEFHGMIGRGPVMQDLFALIRRIAPHVRTALISGETGSGKELVARALYRAGPRPGKRFVVINCAAVVETLFESELFGHTRGAFTGATEHKPGLFEVADGGTLFLDEVGELPSKLQAKLLRVLESGEIQRVGASEPRRVNVHVLAATNRDLAIEAAAGRFRSDLYYRLNVVELRVPPLRDRREDIPYLTAAFVRDTAARIGRGMVGPTPAAERWLAAAPWDGAVRELRNVIERACLLADSEFITERDVGGAAGRVPTAAAAGAVREPVADPSDGALSVVERDHIMAVLDRVGGNKASAARILQLDRRSLYRRIALYGIGGIVRRARS
jgi:DNA-binding NtrC family response regulator